MIYDEEAQEIVFSTGKRVYAFCGVIGLYAGPTHSLANADLMHMSVDYGFDGSIEKKDLTEEERRELALFMIRRWLNWMEAGIPT